MIILHFHFELSYHQIFRFIITREPVQVGFVSRVLRLTYRFFRLLILANTLSDRAVIAFEAKTLQ